VLRGEPLRGRFRVVTAGMYLFLSRAFPSCLWLLTNAQTHEVRLG
jgi:hypothetical protein